MSEYKRLTTTNLNADKITLNTYRGIGKSIYTRLQELEDKIESGQSLELPCKYGDTVYKPCVEQNRILVGEVKRIHYDKQVGHEEFYMTVSCGNRDKDLPWQRQILGFTFNPFTDWNVTVFATHKQAEARLKELRGGKVND